MSNLLNLSQRWSPILLPKHSRIFSTSRLICIEIKDSNRASVWIFIFYTVLNVFKCLSTPPFLLAMTPHRSASLFVCVVFDCSNLWFLGLNLRGSISNSIIPSSPSSPSSATINKYWRCRWNQRICVGRQGRRRVARQRRSTHRTNRLY